MDLQRLTCGACGANLEVPEEVYFVNCRHCGASLKVQWADHVVLTVVTDTILDTTDRLQLNTEILVFQGRLAQLDREWDQASRKFMVRGRRRGYHVPSILLTAIAGFVMASFAWLFSFLAILFTGFEPFFGIGLLFTVLAIYLVTSSAIMVYEFNSALSEYESRRRELILSIEQLEDVRGAVSARKSIIT